MYQRQVQRVLWIVLGANLAVTLIKLLVGLQAGALSALADAFHSGLDASANVIGLVGIALASRGFRGRAGIGSPDQDPVLGRCMLPRKT